MSPLSVGFVCRRRGVRGTNDTKAEFENRQDEVVTNLNLLLDKIKKHPLASENRPGLIFVSPPPIRSKDIADKYKGGNDRLRELLPAFKAAAEMQGFTFVDVFTPLQRVLDYYAEDGVHMSPEGQAILASRIVEELVNPGRQSSRK